MAPIIQVFLWKCQLSLLQLFQVGGQSPIVDEGSSGWVTGRIVSHDLVKTDSDDMIGPCKIVFYYYNLAMNETIGALKLLLTYRYAELQ